jgi:hypothetical protein
MLAQRAGSKSRLLRNAGFGGTPKGTSVTLHADAVSTQINGASEIAIPGYRANARCDPADGPALGSSACS